MTSKTLTGSRLAIYINGSRYGQIMNFKYRSETNHAEIFEIDSLDATEISPTTNKVDGSFDIYRTTADGGIEGAGISQNFADITKGRYFTIQIMDRANDICIFSAKQCRVTSQSWDFSPKGVVMGNISFKGIEWYNEVGPSRI